MSRRALEACRHERNRDAPGAGDPPRSALDWFDRKSLEPSFDFRDVWREEHYHAFTVAKAMREDILEDLRDAVRESIAEGRSMEEFREQMSNTLARKGWWGRQTRKDPKTGEEKVVQLGSPHRLDVIYAMNMRTARSVGQWDRIERTKAIRPVLEYGLGPSENHRPEHAAWAGTRLPVDDPFWDTHMTPNGWGCKCNVRQMSQREADRRGGITPRPSTATRPWKNKRTGEIEEVPIGIDPGWDRNPGKATRQADSPGYESV